MNSEEAKFILQAYRPNTDDDHDPRFIEALDLLKQNQELNQWFEEHQAFDLAVSTKVNELPVPSDLRTNILAGRSLIHRKSFYQQPSFLAMAATVAGVYQFYSSEANPWEEDMVAFLATDFQLDHSSNEIGEVKEWLTSRTAVNQTLPEGLEESPVFGCQTFEWKGRKVALACFTVDGTVVHVFMMNRSDLPQLDSGNDPHFHSVENWATACWGDDLTHYFVASHGGKELLETLLL